MKATFIINVPERTLCESFESNVECLVMDQFVVFDSP